MELDLIRDIVQGIVEELDGIKGKGERTELWPTRKHCLSFKAHAETIISRR